MRPRQLPLLADPIEAMSACSRSASEASCWRPRQLPLIADPIEATLHLLAKQAAGGVYSKRRNIDFLYVLNFRE